MGDRIVVENMMEHVFGDGDAKNRYGKKCWF
jgi:hypothetical protein